jgi:hypothetical protein
MRSASLATLLWSFGLFSCGNSDRYVPRNGDIVFHTSLSSQSVAIQRATRSPFSHMGIVYVESGEPFVFEAIQPVKLTRLEDWTRRGEGGRFVAKRLRDADRLLTPANLAKMRAEGEKLQGKNYDLYFEWSDERIYCSELVWKIYKRALDIEVGKTQVLGDFDLSDTAVREKIAERWKGPAPVNEIVISPAAMFDSDKLVTVYSR